MGRYYQAANPQFIDFIYKPDFELEQKKIQSRLQKEQAELALTDAASEFRGYQGFKGKELQYNQQLDVLKAEANNLTNAFIKDKSDVNMQKMKAAYKTLGDSYIQGDIARSERNYAEIISKYKEAEDTIEKGRAKNPTQANNDLLYLNHWANQKIQEGELEGNGDVTMTVGSPVSYYDAQERLKNVIDKDSLKVVLEQQGADTRYYYNGSKAVLIPSTWVSAPDGSVYDPKDPSKRYNTIKKYFEHTGVGFNYNKYTTNREYYLTDVMQQLAERDLASNVGYQQMLEYDYKNMGARGVKKDANGDYIKDEEQSFEDYRKQRIETEAAIYAEGHRGFKLEEKSTNLVDDAAKMELDNRYKMAQMLKKKELDTKPELIVTTRNTERVHTDAQVADVRKKLELYASMSEKERVEQGVQEEYKFLKNNFDTDGQMSDRNYLKSVNPAIANSVDKMSDAEVTAETDKFKAVYKAMGKMTTDAVGEVFNEDNARQTLNNLKAQGKIPKSMLWMFDDKGNFKYVERSTRSDRNRNAWNTTQEGMGIIRNIIKGGEAQTKFYTDSGTLVENRAKTEFDSRPSIQFTPNTALGQYTSELIQGLTQPGSSGFDYVDVNTSLVDVKGNKNLDKEKTKDVDYFNLLFAANLKGKDGKVITTLNGLVENNYVQAEMINYGNKQKLVVRPTDKMAGVRVKSGENQVAIPDFAILYNPTYNSNYGDLVRPYYTPGSPLYSEGFAQAYALSSEGNNAVHNNSTKITSFYNSKTKGDFAGVGYNNADGISLGKAPMMPYPHMQGISYSVNRVNGLYSATFVNTSKQTMTIDGKAFKPGASVTTAKYGSIEELEKGELMNYQY